MEGHCSGILGLRDMGCREANSGETISRRPVGEGSRRIGAKRIKMLEELGSSTWKGENFVQKMLPCHLGLEQSSHPQMEPYTLTVISDSALSGS